MKAHVVQAPGLTGLKELSPGLNVGGRITCQWEIAATVGPTKYDWPAIEDELLFLGVKIPQTHFHIHVVINCCTF